MQAKELVESIHKATDGRNLHTKEDVSFVLSFVAPPNEKRELKKEVVDLIFTSTSPQGYKTSDDLDSYGEY